MIWWLILLGVGAALLLIKPTRDLLRSAVSRVRDFFKEVMEELKKVSWPAKTELKSSTGLVIFSMLILALFVGVIDLLLNAIIGLLVR